MSTVPDVLYHMGGAPVGGSGMSPRSGVVGQKVCYFVDANNGSAGADGETWQSAFSTIQEAVTTANSVKHKLDNVDILIANGAYAEEVAITRAGTGLGFSVMGWADQGRTIGGIGTLRLIGAGNGVFLYGSDSATTPTLEVGRPNVEIHNFAMIQLNAATADCAPAGWSGTESAGHSTAGMPAVEFNSELNETTLLVSGAANNCLLKNCRVNAGGIGDAGCVLVNGGNWINVEDCTLEYGDDYGLGLCGNLRGFAAEGVYKNIIFRNNTDAHIVHTAYADAQVINPMFVNSPTLTLEDLGTDSVRCQIIGGYSFETANTDFISAGWSIIGHQCAVATHGVLFDVDLSS